MYGGQRGGHLDGNGHGHRGLRVGRPYNHGHEWLERATLSPGSYTALIATLPMLDALYTDLCVQGGTVEGDHYYHHVGGRLAHPSN